MKIHRVLLLILVMKTSICVASSCRSSNVYKLRGHSALVGQVMYTTIADSMVDCTSICLSDENCTSVNFESRVKICEINRGSVTGEIQARSGWNYIIVNGCSAFADESLRVISYSFNESRGLYPATTEARFTCDGGRELIGESVVRCQSREWSGEGYCADNIALQKSASQSSTRLSDYASKAVDGGTAGLFRDGSCSHTDSSGGSGTTNPWLTVDLAGTFKIGLIRVYNRLDSCCYDRLVGAKLIVENGGSETVVATLGEEVNANPTDKPVDMVVGTHITVSLEGDNKVLTLCELEIYGIRA